MVTGRYVISGRRTPVGLVVTSTLIKEETDKLLKFGVVDRGWLGVKTRKPTEQEASALKMDRAKSVVVVGVKEGGPAAAAGLAVGDGIAAFNGHPIRGAFPLVWSVNSLAPDTEVTLGIMRKGVRSHLRVKLGRLPDPSPPKETSSVRATAPDKDTSCLRYVPSVALTVTVACDE